MFNDFGSHLPDFLLLPKHCLILLQIDLVIVINLSADPLKFCSLPAVVDTVEPSLITEPVLYSLILGRI